MSRLMLQIQGNARRHSIALALAVVAGLSGSAGAGDPATTLVRVEEDWVALVDEPDTAISSPQICCVISPTQDLEGAFGQIQINHRGYPSFQEGGIQVQGLFGESVSGTNNASRTARLYRTSDNLRFTVGMSQVTDGVQFEVKDVRSRTWGSFASSGIKVTVPTTETSLDAYSPEFSLENSMVNLGAHRIDILYITTIRKTFADGHTETDYTDRVSHRYQLEVDDVPVELYEANPDEYNTDITEVE